jgi:NAD(P)H-nitrite reductase large subunit
VIGGGLLGIEAAYGLAKAGASVTLVHPMDRLMERQLDARAALLLKRSNQLTRNHPQRGPRMRGARRAVADVSFAGTVATVPSL